MTDDDPMDMDTLTPPQRDLVEALADRWPCVGVAACADTSGDVILSAFRVAPDEDGEGDALAHSWRVAPDGRTIGGSPGAPTDPLAATFDG